MLTMQQRLDNITLVPTDMASFNYAKCREEIDALGENREERRNAKMIVITHLGGKICQGRRKFDVKESNYVLFPDGSKAKF